MRTLFLMLLVVGLFLVACNQGSETAEPSDHTGTYSLVSIDGNELPYTPSHAGGAPQVLSSTLTLNADGTFHMSMSYGTESGNPVSREFNGTYTREDSSFRLQWEGAGVTTGTLEGDTLTIDNEGLLFAYRK